MSRILAIFAATATLGALLIAGARPALAHAGDAVEASNYRTTITDLPTALGDVTLEVIDLGDRVRLTNPTDEEVVVVGYEGEPYLRIGPDGVFENVNSPATYLNQERIPQDIRVPDTADAQAKPDWRNVGDGDSVVWHDHRVHWMSLDDPPQVAEDPGAEHVIIPAWEIDLLVDGEEVVVAGDLTWVPGPSPLLWLLIALGLGVLVVLAAFWKHWAAGFMAALALLLALDLVHVVGNWSGPAVLVVTILSWIVAIAALAKLARSDRDGAFWVILAGLLFALFGGLADIAVVSRSQVEFAFGAPLVRLAVAASLGIGFGLAIGGAIVLTRVPAPAPDPAPPPPEPA